MNVERCTNDMLDTCVGWTNRRASWMDGQTFWTDTLDK